MRSRNVLSPEVVVDDVSTQYRNALAFHRRGYLEAAEGGYRSVLVAVPDHAGAWHFLGLILHQKHQFDDAIRHLERAISLRQDKAVYFNNYGVVLKDAGRLNDALAAFQQAVELDPVYADAHANLAATHLLRNDLTRAENELAVALTRRPDHVAGRNVLRELRFRQGNLLFAQGRFAPADRAFHEAASLPAGKEIWRWKSLGFCPPVFPDEQSIDHYWAQLDHHLDRAIDADIPLDWRALPDDGCTPSFNLPHLNKCCRGIKEKFATLFARVFPFERPTLKETQKNRTKMRVGFVVTAGHHRGFLRVHRHLLEHLDRRKFEVFAICPAPILASCRQTISEHILNRNGPLVRTTRGRPSVQSTGYY